MPLKKKTVRVVSSPKKRPNRLTKLRNWRDEGMTGAIEAIKGVNPAVAEFRVPASKRSFVRSSYSRVQSYIYLPKKRANLLHTSPRHRPSFSTPTSRGTTVRSLRTGARVLTSAESMCLLEEKEAQKKR